MYIKFIAHVDLLADLQHNRKLFYMILMYPFLPVVPQEVIFREFFFYRYETMFRSRVVLIVANVLLFAFAHIYFQNWTVIIFTIIGGGIFSWTYSQTRSLLVVSIEHTLYGLMILSSGLGEQFYKAF